MTVKDCRVKLEYTLFEMINNYSNKLRINYLKTTLFLIKTHK